MSGTQGRVYGGDASLIHVIDGGRQELGAVVASALDEIVREEAVFNGLKTAGEVTEQKLCPGCYMVVSFNALVQLARENGQSLKELGLTMAVAFQQLAFCEDYDEPCSESIDVILDPPQ